MKKILILFVHPSLQKSRINKKLINSVQNLDNIAFHNLYEEYPDFHIDVPREQNLLLEHDVIIWHHPFYWYSAPSILKEWIDLVLEHNFAYGRHGKALSGKEVMTVITTGGRREAYQDGGYNRYTIRQLLSPFEQTARLCNMKYLPPFVVHGTHLINEEDITIFAEEYKKILISLRDEIFSSDEIISYEYMNDLIA
jgi:glutathione-regulated potassium-efflux system ancillary protein KefG